MARKGNCLSMRFTLVFRWPSLQMDRNGISSSPENKGDYGERRVYKLDIVERDVSECVARLTRYLQYDAIVSDVAPGL